MRDRQVAGCLSQINCVTVGGIISVPRPSSIVSLSEVLETQEDWLKRNPGRTSQDWTNYIQKYFLSARAARGILRRAARRGKELPEMLHRALLQVAGELSEPERAEGKMPSLPSELTPSKTQSVSGLCQSAHTKVEGPNSFVPFDQWIQDTKDWGGTWEEWFQIYVRDEIPYHRTSRSDWIQAYQAMLDRPDWPLNVVAFDWQSGGDVRHNVSEHHTSALQSSQVPAVAFQPRYARNGRGAPDEIAAPLTAEAGKTGKGDSAQCVALWQATTPEGVRVQESSETSPTLTKWLGTGGHNVPMWGVRRLTPKECRRLQGFDDDWNDGQSDSAAYRQLGNAVCVNVIEWIGHRLVAVAEGRTP